MIDSLAKMYLHSVSMAVRQRCCLKWYSRTDRSVKLTLRHRHHLSHYLTWAAEDTKLLIMLVQCTEYLDPL